MHATLFATTSEPWPLRSDDVHVWRFACEGDVGALAGTLSAEELATAARFVASVHRERYLVQHAMVRGLLARYLELAPAAIRFDRGLHGKPFVAGPFQFNLSHADDIALLAVTRGIGVGVDVERLASKLEPSELAATVLAPDEPAADRAAFLRIWCRKEAALKATGVGLVDDLPSVSVARDRAIVDGVTVYLQDLAIGSDHAAALATTIACAQVGPAELETFEP